MFQIILVSGAIFILFLTSCTVNILAPDGYEMEDYPSTWEPLAVVKKNKDCVDISGRYYSSYGLLEIIEKIDNDSIVLSSNPNIIEFTIKSEKSLEIKGFRGSDLLFRKETKFACNAGFVSITLHTEFAGGLFIGYGTERVHFGTTRARHPPSPGFPPWRRAPRRAPGAGSEL